MSILTQIAADNIGEDIQELIRYKVVTNQAKKLSFLQKIIGNEPKNEARSSKSQYTQTGAQLTGFIGREIQATELHFGEAEKHLAHLNLSHNTSLQKITFTGDFPSLKRIYLNDCKLTILDISQATFPALTQLYVQNNLLTELVLPQNCPELVLLDASKNELIQLELGRDFEALAFLFLKGNKLILDESIWNKQENCAKEMKDYLREAGKGTIINEQIKLIIVGNGRAGKTSMYKVLKGLKFNENEGYTHAISLGTLEKKHLPDLLAEMKNPQIKVWDFGGQEIFYATHQFFLGEKAVYILAWTNEKILLEHRAKAEKESIKYDKPRLCAYWLENIKLRAKAAKPLMVRTHFHYNRAYRECEEAEKHPKSLHFDAKSSYNLSVLQEEIALILNEKWQDKQHSFGNEIAETWDKVSKAVAKKRKTTPFLDFETGFIPLCKGKNWQIETGGELSVAKYLDDIGEIVYFPDDSQLKNIVYIDPNWLINQVYRLLEDAETIKQRKGKIDAAYLQQIFPESEYTDTERSNFVALLKNFKLIFEEKEEGYYIAPQYLQEELAEDTQVFYDIILNSLDLVFEFRFSEFLPENLIINFLCEYGPYAKKFYWRNGICFAQKDTGIPCVVTCDEASRTLAVYTKSEGKNNGKNDVFLLQKEICNMLQTLGGNAEVEISVDKTKETKVFVPMDTIKKQYLKRQKNTHFLYGEKDTPIYFSMHNFLFDGGHEVGKQVDLRELIASNRFTEAFALLFEQYPNNDALYLQKGRFRHNQDEWHGGRRRPDEYDIELNKIRNSLLEFSKQKDASFAKD